MKQHNDRVLYVVAWEADEIVKIGFTCNLRRRLHAFPGAQLILALGMPDLIAGYNFEIHMHREARSRWPHAFADRAEALPYLPDRGHGRMECYRATPAAALDLIASQCSVTVGRHDTTSHCDVTLTRHGRDGRTDVLTEIFVTVIKNPYGRNVRARIFDFAAPVVTS